MAEVSPTSVSAWDMLARLAVHYLAAAPQRIGMLVREQSTGFTERAPLPEPPAILSPGNVLAWSRQRRAERLASVGGNEALLTARRADAVWVDITEPQHPLIEAHEIKVTRSDLLAELRQPEKAAMWMQQAHRFWLTVPDPALIAGLSLPEQWGVLALPHGSVPTVVRPAPALTPARAVRSDLPDYVRRNAETRWHVKAEGARPCAGRYTVASRMPPQKNGWGNQRLPD